MTLKFIIKDLQLRLNVEFLLLSFDFENPLLIIQQHQILVKLPPEPISNLDHDKQMSSTPYKLMLNHWHRLQQRETFMTYLVF